MQSLLRAKDKFQAVVAAFEVLNDDEGENGLFTRIVGSMSAIGPVSLYVNSILGTTVILMVHLLPGSSINTLHTRLFAERLVAEMVVMFSTIGKDQGINQKATCTFFEWKP
jgi:hypothetical protein